MYLAPSAGDAGSAWRTAGVSRLVVVGSPWRVSLDNPSCRTFTETRVQGNYSTIATPYKQCQTQFSHVTRVFQARADLELISQELGQWLPRSEMYCAEFTSCNPPGNS